MEAVAPPEAEGWGGVAHRRAGNGHFASAPNSSFETKNGKIYMAVANQKLFVDACKAMSHPEWATDPRFATIADRVANKPLLTKMMEDVLKTDTKENWGHKLRHLPAALAHSPGFVLRNWPRMLAHTFTGTTWRSALGLEGERKVFARFRQRRRAERLAQRREIDDVLVNTANQKPGGAPSNLPHAPAPVVAAADYDLTTR